MAEAVYQRLVLGRLEVLRPRVRFWRANTGFARDGRGRGVRFGEPGQPDILGVAAGRGFGIEVKDDGERQRPEQREWQSSWELAGGIYLLAVGKDGALAAVERVRLMLLEAPW